MAISRCNLLQVIHGAFAMQTPYLSKLPIPDALPADRAAIVALVQKCLDAKGQGPQVDDWEAEINERVAWLYGLKGEEVAPVEGDGV
jgi:adenine-specific DNA-methyltransferase